MTAEHPQGPISSVRLHKQLQRIWDTAPGWGHFSAVNHTVLGKRFIVTAFVFFAIGGVLAMLIRAQLATSHSGFLEPEVYNQIFTMHGTIMMFLFAIPMFEGFAIYLLPKMLGARDMAFPRLTAYGYWCYLLGGSILVIAMLAGVAPNGGWFMYTPLNSQPYAPGINADIWLIGITFVEISALSAAVEIIVSILKLRAPGMSIDRMPIMAWYLLITAFMMLLGFPPLILGSILLEVERAFGLPFFDPERGGDALLWQHLFWLFGHPEVYIIFLPAAGAISMMIPTFVQHELVGYRIIIVAVIAVAFLSFGLWVHHMFTVGIPHLALSFFSAASGLVAIPTAVQIFAWIATIGAGKPRFDVPMLYLGGFFVVFIFGGLTGVMLAMVPFNFQAHDTQFVVAHLHYVLVGGFIFPMLAGAYYWLPHITGRAAEHRLAVPAFWMIFGGFNLTFFIMHLTGLLGMPRRIPTYPQSAGWDWLNLISSIGGFIMALGFALFVVDIIVQFRFGKRARRNFWQARTLEWATPTPPPSYGFASLPLVTDRADRADPGRLGPQLAAGKGYLGFTRNGWMETLAVDMVTGKPTEVVVLPRPTYLPLFSGLATAAIVICLLAKLYLLAAVPLAIVVVLFFCWSRTTGSQTDMPDLDIGLGETAPPHWQTARPPSWWAMAFTLVADATLFASLLFATVFLWVVAPAWPPEQTVAAFLPLLIVALVSSAAAAASGRWAIHQLARGANPGIQIAGVIFAHLVALVALGFAMSGLGDVTLHAQAATTFVLLCYAVLHVAVGALLGIYAFWRNHQGMLSAVRSLDLRIGSLWHDYTVAVILICVVARLAVRI
ncbi:cytochrome c oxidase subunit I [Aureimonas fodinaquatilis]|uniref:cytochrome-c oxidase n=1 Tax=Aureimonas fodinaquatilis TaxID=2565783 RepID=A0A5B0DX85_9HYPH|nr:cytochrome c oxidase subunit I [Aureimonas fodinaquatilis]KAA0970612.1 cytochrome c oxidase subunit I [Aureimonas fodinaquatilis]